MEFEGNWWREFELYETFGRRKKTAQILAMQWSGNFLNKISPTCCKLLVYPWSVHILVDFNTTFLVLMSLLHLVFQQHVSYRTWWMFISNPWNSLPCLTMSSDCSPSSVAKRLCQMQWCTSQKANHSWAHCIKLSLCTPNVAILYSSIGFQWIEKNQNFKFCIGQYSRLRYLRRGMRAKLNIELLWNENSGFSMAIILGLVNMRFFGSWNLATKHAF